MKINGYFKVREEVDLKPCPFCGGEAYITGVFVPKYDDEINAYEVGCEKCGVAFSSAWEYRDIVDKWNGRVCWCKQKENCN